MDGASAGPALSAQRSWSLTTSTLLPSLAITRCRPDLWQPGSTGPTVARNPRPPASDGPRRRNASPLTAKRCRSSSKQKCASARSRESRPTTDWRSGWPERGSAAACSSSSPAGWDVSARSSSPSSGPSSCCSCSTSSDRSDGGSTRDRMCREHETQTRRIARNRRRRGHRAARARSRSVAAALPPTQQRGVGRSRVPELASTGGGMAALRPPAALPRRTRSSWLGHPACRRVAETSCHRLLRVGRDPRRGRRRAAHCATMTFGARLSATVGSRPREQSTAGCARPPALLPA